MKPTATKLKRKPATGPTFTLQGDEPQRLFTLHSDGVDIWAESHSERGYRRYSAHFVQDPNQKLWIQISGLVCFPCDVGTLR